MVMYSGVHNNQPWSSSIKLAVISYLKFGSDNESYILRAELKRWKDLNGFGRR